MHFCQIFIRTKTRCFLFCSFVQFLFAYLFAKIPTLQPFDKVGIMISEVARRRTGSSHIIFSNREKAGNHLWFTGFFSWAKNYFFSTETIRRSTVPKAIIKDNASNTVILSPLPGKSRTGLQNYFTERKPSLSMKNCSDGFFFYLHFPFFISSSVSRKLSAK